MLEQTYGLVYLVLADFLTVIQQVFLFFHKTTDFWCCIAHLSFYNINMTQYCSFKFAALSRILTFFKPLSLLKTKNVDS